MGGGCYSARVLGGPQREALEGDGRALEAAGRASKTLRQAFEADGRALKAARGWSGGKE